MKSNVYNVELLENSIHLEPKTKCETTANGKPRRLCQKSEVYQWPNGKIDVLFKENPEPQRPPTLTELASFPFCRIMHSKRRVNIILSFGKAEAEIAERQLIFDHDKWFEAIAAASESQKGGAE